MDCLFCLRLGQLYVYRDRELTMSIIRRAEAAGFSAIVLTVDTPVLGALVFAARHVAYL